MFVACDSFDLKSVSKIRKNSTAFLRSLSVFFEKRVARYLKNAARLIWLEEGFD